MCHWLALTWAVLDVVVCAVSNMLWHNMYPSVVLFLYEQHTDPGLRVCVVFMQFSYMRLSVPCVSVSALTLTWVCVAWLVHVRCEAFSQSSST